MTNEELGRALRDPTAVSYFVEAICDGVMACVLSEGPYEDQDGNLVFPRIQFSRVTVSDYQFILGAFNNKVMIAIPATIFASSAIGDVAGDNIEAILEGLNRAVSARLLELFPGVKVVDFNALKVVH